MDAFTDKVAVVTGGGSGIGAAMARAFAARGAKLVLADIDEAALASVAGELTAKGTAVLTRKTDVGERAQVEALARAAEEKFGAVHVVCNNAGIGVYGEIADVPHADWEYTMRVNFWGVVHGVETFAPRLIAQRGGHIVNTASMAGCVGMQWLGVYCASKFAVVGLSEALYRELGRHGVGVSVLCPMIVDTRINENSIRLRPDALKKPGGDDFIPPAAAMAGSVITPEEVARRVVRAVDRRDFYIFTHPEQREILRKRAARQDRMFEPDMW